MKNASLLLLCLLAPSTALAAELAIRSFEPAGEGRVSVDGVEHRFSLAECRFGEERLAAGMKRDIYVLGSGQIDEAPFFIEGALLHRDAYREFRLVLTYAPLFQAYDDAAAAPETVTAMVNALITAEVLEASLAPDLLVVEGEQITVEGPFAWRASGDRLLEGDLAIDCR